MCVQIKQINVMIKHLLLCPKANKQIISVLVSYQTSKVISFVKKKK